MAAWSSAKFSNRRPLSVLGLTSSSLDVCIESGGDMMAPGGMDELLTGGGDCWKLDVFIEPRVASSLSLDRPLTLTWLGDEIVTVDAAVEASGDLEKEGVRR